MFFINSISIFYKFYFYEKIKKNKPRFYETHSNINGLNLPPSSSVFLSKINLLHRAAYLQILLTAIVSMH